MINLDPPASRHWVTSSSHWSCMSFWRQHVVRGYRLHHAGVQLCLVSNKQRRTGRAPFAGKTPQGGSEVGLGPRKLYLSSPGTGSPAGRSGPTPPRFSCRTEGRSVRGFTLLGERPYSLHGDTGPHLFFNKRSTPAHSPPSKEVLAFSKYLQSILKVLLPSGIFSEHTQWWQISILGR